MAMKLVILSLVTGFVATVSCSLTSKSIHNPANPPTQYEGVYADLEYGILCHYISAICPSPDALEIRCSEVTLAKLKQNFPCSNEKAAESEICSLCSLYHYR